MLVPWRVFYGILFFLNFSGFFFVPQIDAASKSFKAAVLGGDFFVSSRGRPHVEAGSTRNTGCLDGASNLEDFLRKMRNFLDDFLWSKFPGRD